MPAEHLSASLSFQHKTTHSEPEAKANYVPMPSANEDPNRCSDAQAGHAHLSPNHGPNGQAGNTTIGSISNVYAWLQVLGAFFVLFNIWGLPISFGAFQSYYLSYLPHSSSSAISWVGTVQGFLLIFIGVLSGPLFDLGYNVSMLAAGSFLTILGIMMLSLSTEYYQVFLSQGVCTGLGCGLLYVPCLAVLGRTFEARKRAVAMGIATSGIAVGGIIYTILLLELLQPVGFGWTVRVLGFVCAATFVLAILCLTYGAKKQSSFIAGEKIDDSTANTRSLIDKTALRSSHFLLFTLAQFVLFLGYLVPLFYVPTYAQVEVDVSEAYSLWILVLAQGTSAVGRILFGAIASRVGGITLWTFCSAASGVLCFTWIATDSVGGFMVFSGLFGFFSGALVALPPVVFPTLFSNEESAKKKLGTRIGMSWCVTAFAFLIGTPVAGKLGDAATGDFVGVQVWSGAMLLGGAGVLILLGLVVTKSERRDSTPD